MFRRMTTCDLAIVGGGITGVGIARLAARNGLSVVVLERGDLAGGTSSVSSHMLHGGLRYLEHGHLRLVRESLLERDALTRMAPGLTRRQRFLVPLYAGDRVGPWRLRAGLTLYDWLAGRHGFEPHRMAGADETAALEPALARDGLAGAGLYSDGVMDDARLAVAVARDAARHGAAILTYHDVRAARRTEDGTVELVAADTLDGGTRRVRARFAVNATGPWTDAVRAALLRDLRPGTAPTPLLGPSRGVHLVYPRLTGTHGLLLVARRDGRVFFVVPFGQHALVGTTEVAVASPPPQDAWRPTVDEARYLADELARVLPGAAALRPVAVFAGIRPLLRAEGGAGGAPREHAVVDDGPLVTIAGGKYTGFRVMARALLAHVAPRLGRAADTIVDDDDPLPLPLPPGESVERIAEFAARHEFARRAEDVVRRRSTLWLEPDGGRAAAVRVAARLAQELDWNAARTRDEGARHAAACDADDGVLRAAGLREEP